MDIYAKWNPPVLSARGLFERALQEVDELGTKPSSGSTRHWEEERRDSLTLLAELAGHDGFLLARSQMCGGAQGDRRNKKAMTLLRDARRYAWRGRTT